MSGTPSVGATLFNFTDEWRAGTVADLTRLLERVAAADLGPDVELVGYQSFRGLPAPTVDEVDRFRTDVERLGLRPSAFGVYVDRARRPGEWLSVDESLTELTGQLRTADRLGFRIARATLGMDPAVLDRVVPVLDEIDVVLTFEIQGPHAPDAPDVVALVNWLERNAGAPVGITLDTSVAMPDLPPSLRRTLRGLGVPPAVEDLLEAAWWRDGPPHRRIAALHEQLGPAAVPAAASELVTTAFIRFGHGDLDDWCHVLPWVRHAHAKFWDWEAPDAQVVAPVERLAAMLAEVGYAGSVSSEFGGIAWLPREDIDVFDLTRRHVALLRTTVDRAIRCGSTTGGPPQPAAGRTDTESTRYSAPPGAEA